MSSSVSGKAAEDILRAWDPAFTVETKMEFLAPRLCLTQCLALWPVGE